MVQKLDVNPTSKLMREFILQYKNSMAHNKIRKDDIVHIIGLHLGVNAETILEYHNILIRNSVYKLMHGDIEEIYRIMLPIMVISNGWDRGFNCSVLYDTGLDFDKFEFYLTQLVLGHNIDYISLSYLSIDELDAISNFIYKSGAMTKGMLKSSNAVGIYILYKIYCYDKTLYEIIDKKAFGRLLDFSQVDYIVEHSLMINKYIDYVKDVKFPIACAVLLSELEYSNEIPNIKDLFNVVKKYAEPDSYKLYQILTKLAGSLQGEYNIFTNYMTSEITNNLLCDTIDRTNYIKYMDKTLFSKLKK